MTIRHGLSLRVLPLAQVRLLCPLVFSLHLCSFYTYFLAWPFICFHCCSLPCRQWWERSWGTSNGAWGAWGRGKTCFGGWCWWWCYCVLVWWGYCFSGLSTTNFFSSSSNFHNVPNLVTVMCISRNGVKLIKIYTQIDKLCYVHMDSNILCQSVKGQRKLQKGFEVLHY